LKRRLIAAVLILALLLPAGSVSAAGTTSDPLISLSYVNGTFIPGMMSAVKAMLSEAMEAHFSSSATVPSGMVTERIGTGGSIKLRTGQTVILLSGSARISAASGSIVNATIGAETTIGALNPCHRYIVCEDSAVSISIFSDALVSVSAAAEITAGAPISPFTDVTSGQWWYSDILKAYERGLVNGMTPTTYVPKGELSISQAVKLAACMHQLYHEGKVTLANSSSGPWYQSYVDYCLQKGILPAPFTSYNEAINRRQFVELFHAALPQSDYVAINSIPAGSIGDISENGSWVNNVYDFYRAGILTGYTADGVHAAHDFGAESSITRAEVATIMNRMFDHSARVQFTIE